MTYQGFTAEVSEEKLSKEPEPKEKTKDLCPKCGESTGEVEFGRYKYTFCSSCSFRERKSG
jgi:hypothetical protein